MSISKIKGIVAILVALLLIITYCYICKRDETNKITVQDIFPKNCTEIVMLRSEKFQESKLILVFPKEKRFMQSKGSYKNTEPCSFDMYSINLEHPAFKTTMYYCIENFYYLVSARFKFSKEINCKVSIQDILSKFYIERLNLCESWTKIHIRKKNNLIYVEVFGIQENIVPTYIYNIGNNSSSAQLTDIINSYIVK